MRETEKDICIEELNLNFQNPKMTPADVKRKHAEKEKILNNLISEMKLFSQPVVNLPQLYNKVQGIKDQVKKRMKAKAYSFFLDYDYSQIPIALLISVMRHVKYGSDIVLNNGESSQMDLYHLRLCFDTITLVHLLKLKPLEDYLIKTVLVSKLLTVETAPLVCQFAIIHLNLCQQSQIHYHTEINNDNNSDNSGIFLASVECESH